MPWISWPAIDFLDKNFFAEKKFFEWGTGGSTIFFASKGCFVTSIESNDQWLNKVRIHIKNKILPHNPRIRFIAAETKKIDLINQYVKSVREGSPWDIILVDGLSVDYTSRVDCVLEAKENIKENGLIIVDDSYFHELRDVPDILKNFKRLEFWGLGPARWGLTKTDIYINLS